MSDDGTAGEDPPDDVALRRSADAAETVAANRSWWDAQADGYYTEHGAFLGDAELVWGPEGLRESQAGLLGDVLGRRVLEIGAGAGQGARYLSGQGAEVVASDLSAGMLRTAVRLGRLPFVQCDGAALPFADGSFDTVFTAYGVVPFVADSAAVMHEAARVLRPGGRFVFSTTHPVRWTLPDDPGPDGLSVRFSYFDRTPYVEQRASGAASYVEHHRTLGDRVREITEAGLSLVDLVEPEWPEDNSSTWGGWSPLRGAVVPGTAIFVAEKP